MVKLNCVWKCRITTNMHKDLTDLSNSVGLKVTDLARLLLARGLATLKYDIKTKGLENLQLSIKLGVNNG